VNKQDKRRLYIISAVLIVAVILLFLAKRAQGAGSTVINQGGGITLPGFDGGFNLSDMPGLNYVPGDYINNSIGGSKGCALCYSGYSRIETVSPPRPAARMAPPSTTIVNIPRNFGGGASWSGASVGGMSTQGGSQPASNSWWNVTGRFF
jgi:hypothetical protein